MTIYVKPVGRPQYLGWTTTIGGLGDLGEGWANEDLELDDVRQNFFHAFFLIKFNGVDRTRH